MNCRQIGITVRGWYISVLLSMSLIFSLLLYVRDPRTDLEWRSVRYTFFFFHSSSAIISLALVATAEHFIIPKPVLAARQGPKNIRPRIRVNVRNVENAFFPLFARVRFKIVGFKSARSCSVSFFLRDALRKFAVNVFPNNDFSRESKPVLKKLFLWKNNGRVYYSYTTMIYYLRLDFSFVPGTRPIRSEKKITPNNITPPNRFWAHLIISM